MAGLFDTLTLGTLAPVPDTTTALILPIDDLKVMVYWDRVTGADTGFSRGGGKKSVFGKFQLLM